MLPLMMSGEGPRHEVNNLLTCLISQSTSLLTVG